MDSARPLRHAVIGVGAGIFANHRQSLELTGAELVGVSDLNGVVARERAEELGCPAYVDHRRLLEETQPEVVVVVTPHPFHAAIAIDALEAGCHVLVEKPIAVQVAEADAMIEAADRLGRILAVNFQYRHDPAARAAHRLLREGALGEIQHVDVTAAVPRTRAYFASAPWRGAWNGEGGGVLLNQAAHHLDLLCYLMGLPEAVVAWTPTLLHDIETEDTAQAMLRWPGGALGSLHVSTAEAGRPERFEFVGTRGYLRLSGAELWFERSDVDFREYICYSEERYRGPERRIVPVEFDPGRGDHLAVYRDLHAAIRGSGTVAVDGREGLMSLELANAMIASYRGGGEVTLPLDRERYARLLAELQERGVA